LIADVIALLTITCEKWFLSFQSERTETFRYVKNTRGERFGISFLTEHNLRNIPNSKNHLKIKIKTINKMADLKAFAEQLVNLTVKEVKELSSNS
jgi:hypothetical protein